MAEWLKAHAWKACLGETLTWVRIPLSPPAHSRKYISRRNLPDKVNYFMCLRDFYIFHTFYIFYPVLYFFVNLYDHERNV